MKNLLKALLISQELKHIVSTTNEQHLKIRSSVISGVDEFVRRPERDLGVSVDRDWKDVRLRISRGRNFRQLEAI